MAYGALNFRGRGLEPLGDAGVKLLGYAAAEGGLKVYHAHRLPQVMVALYVGGYTYHEEYRSDFLVQSLGFGAYGTDLRALCVGALHHVHYALVQRIGVDGLDHVILCAKCAGLPYHLLLTQGAYHYDGRHVLHEAAVKPLKELKAVHARHDEIAQEHIVPVVVHCVQGGLTVVHGVHPFYSFLSRKVIPDGGLELVVAVCQKYAVFSHIVPP